MHIALVGDDKAIAQRIFTALSEGFLNRGAKTNIQMFETSTAFIHTASRETFDLICLDWHLPDGTGIALLDWMNKYLEEVPAVIMVTHRKNEADIIQALDAGADDFISKPFRPRELAARAYAVSRRNPLLTASSTQSHLLKSGRVELNTEQNTACVDGQSIELTHQEFRLAYLLLKRMGAPLSRAYLYKYVWGHDTGLNTRTLDVHIHRVRKKLRLTADYGWDLASIYGYGYRLKKVELPQQTQLEQPLPTQPIPSDKDFLPDIKKPPP
ncbi:response regulator transcription factor [Halomonas sp. SpR8]|uniref:response regulator transcription factor n=1 Tax=Halomonas sp. SpR8 TaxID=3050463 RepID=UPI0027E445A7|nr:response regulator transcription factor [Halomonas sp. SpR8]MDQ7730967.1 response regulator transcription factor [Halomonas sp. SpR8]